MARLLTVVNERKKIRDLYRNHLESQYIQEKKKEAREKYKEKIMQDRQDGIKTPRMHSEIYHILKDKKEKKR